MSMMEAALEYRALGLAPIPCHEKRPLVPWLPYQGRLPTEQEVKHWFQTWPDANVALVLPKGAVVADLDGPEATALLEENGISLPASAPSSTTGKGRHVWLHSRGEDVQNKVGLFKRDNSQVDIRAFGGYVLVPPSVHPNGKTYTWDVPLSKDNPAPPAPDGLIDALRGKGHRVVIASQVPSWISDAMSGVPEGQRDDMAARLAGYFLSKDIPQEIVLAILEPFASKCVPPLHRRDLQRVVRSIASRDSREKRENDLCVDHISDVVARVLKEIEDPVKRPGIVSNFASLNRFLPDGFRPGDLIYLGARPAVGKTALALDFCRSAARHGRNTVFVSREMLVTALCRRMIAQEGHIDATRFKMGMIPKIESDPVTDKLASLPIWLTDSAKNARDIRKIVEGLGVTVDFLVVDYLQLLQPTLHVSERRHQVEAVSQELKDLATSLEVPVLALSSLSRPSNQSPNAAPDLSRLRESGELEHDADVIIFLHRPSLQAEEVDAIVAKNREGAVGTARLRFKPEWVSFFDDLEASSTENE